MDQSITPNLAPPVNRRWLIYLIVVVLIALVGIVWYVKKQKDSVETVSTTPVTTNQNNALSNQPDNQTTTDGSASAAVPAAAATTAPTVDTKNWKTYTNKLYGFSFKYPADKMIVEESNSFPQVGLKSRETYKIESSSDNPVYYINFVIYYGGETGFTKFISNEFQTVASLKIGGRTVNKVTTASNLECPEGLCSSYHIPVLRGGKLTVNPSFLKKPDVDTITLVTSLIEQTMTFEPIEKEAKGSLVTVADYVFDTSGWAEFSDSQLGITLKYPSDILQKPVKMGDTGYLFSYVNPDPLMNKRGILLSLATGNITSQHAQLYAEYNNNPDSYHKIYKNGREFFYDNTLGGYLLIPMKGGLVLSLDTLIYINSSSTRPENIIRVPYDKALVKAMGETIVLAE